MELRYTAIVIAKRDINEADRLYTFMTREGGKVRAKAIGVRKPHAKLASSLETLSLADITIVRGRGMGKVAGAIVEETFPHLRTEYEFLSTGLEAAGIVDSFVGLEVPDQRLFEQFYEYLLLLDWLAKDGKLAKVALLSEGFFVKLLDELGYRMEASVCAVSGEKFSREERYFFSPEAGGVVRSEYAGRDAIQIGENTIKLIRIILGNKLASLLRLRVEKRDVEEMRNVRRIFLQYIVG